MNTYTKPQIQPQSLFCNGNASNILQMYKMARKPNEALETLCKQNPLFASVMDMCKDRNPKDVFFEECEKKGVNPEAILSFLK